MARRTWLVLPDQLSIRMFFDSGVVDGLRERTGGALAAVFLVPRDEASDWTDRVGDAPVLLGEHLTAERGALRERVPRRVDTFLDRQIGYHPLAIRLNYRHGFHEERMHPGHQNWMLDSARVGPMPRWAPLEKAMERWHFSAHRHVPRRLLDGMRRSCSGLALSNVQPRNAVPFLVAARRLGLPIAAHVASWDHTVGKGVISPHCDVYIVQNRVMEDDLRRYHDIEPERVVVTGWPQTDVFLRRRPREDYDALLRRYGLDPERPLVLVMGNTPTNAPYEDRFVQRMVSWWDETARERFQLLFRPHPRDKLWRERFAAAGGREGVFVQEASYTDLEELTVLLQHGDVVVCNAGTIMLDALVNDRPVVCVLYDEGAPSGESWAAKNVIGEHYRDLAASGAFLTAETFDEVVAGIDRSLEQPGELAEERRRAVACVGAAGLLGVFKLDDAVAVFDYQADVNAAATFTDRTYPAFEFLPGSARVMEDARLWMPEDATYRVVHGRRFAGQSRAGSLNTFLGVLLMPRRLTESESALWVFCHGCAASTLGPEYEVLSDSGQGFQFARRRS